MRTARLGLLLAALALAGALPAHAARLIGTPKADVLAGKPRADVIKGRGGADRLRGRGGDDRIAGGAGNDRLDGGPGNDRLDGGGGRDRLTGGAGRDRLAGGKGDDTVAARDGAADRVRCGPGRDTVTADTVDRVAADCETATLPVPGGPDPDPLPTPTPSVTPGPTATPTETPGPGTNPGPEITGLARVDVDRGAPAPVTAQVTDPDGVAAVTLRYRPLGADSEPATVAMTKNGDSYSAAIPSEALVASDQEFEVDAADSKGATSRSAAFAAVADFTPDPPPLNAAEPATVFDAAAGIYSGPTATQTGVAAGTIAAEQVALLRGVVKDRAGQPLQGVLVRILDGPEYGSTRTGADGSFALAFNGAETVLVFERGDLIAIQRQVEPGWQEWEALDDVVMIGSDPTATQVDLSGGATAWQTHRSTLAVDATGARRATVLFPPAVQAFAQPPGAVESALSTGTVRVSEYTIGDTGPQAMPAMLPPMSQYTYAADFTLDEAEALGAATRVRFTAPVTALIDNFLAMPVGASVPLGAYDEQAGVWEAEDNGLVIRVVDEPGGVAGIDVDSERPGGDAEADPDRYSALGLTEGERERIAAIYDAGAELTRLRLEHFSPHDPNYPWLADFTRPDEDVTDEPEEPEDKDCHDLASGFGTVRCDDGALLEEVPLVGLPFTLAYSSARQPSTNRNSVEVDLTPSTPLPGTVRSVIAYLEVGGRMVDFDGGSPESVDKVTLTWDGRDAFFRPLPGRQRGVVEVSYELLTTYGEALAFGMPATAGLAPTQRVFAEVKRYEEVTLGGAPTAAAAVDGWDLSLHHTYDPGSQTLHLGTGEDVVQEALDLTAATIAGGPSSPNFQDPASVAPLDDGSVIVADNVSGSGRLRKIAADGTVTTIAGGGSSFEDDIPVAQADLGKLVEVRPGRDGRIFIYSEVGPPAGSGGNVARGLLRVIEPDGTIRRLAGQIPGGSGQCTGGCTGPHTDKPKERPLLRPRVLAVADDGAVYYNDGFTELWRLDPSEQSADLVAGGVASCCPVNPPDQPFPAQTANLGIPLAIDVAPDGTIYLAVDNGFVSPQDDRVLAIDPNGVVRRVAGGGTDRGSGVTVADAKFDELTSIAVGDEGELYVTSRAGATARVQEIRNGIVRNVAGGVSGPVTSGQPALQTRLTGAVDVVLDPQGELVVLDAGNSRLVSVEPPLPEFDAKSIFLPSQDATLLYEFTSRGRHLTTRDIATRKTIWTFDYDADGRLTGVTDREGDRTALARDATTGQVETITSPDTDVTTLDHGGAGNVTRIEDELGHAWEFAYDDGLITRKTDPRGNDDEFDYDARGRVTRAGEPDGGFVDITREQVGDRFDVIATTALGRVTRVGNETLADGTLRRTRTDPNGLTTTIDNRPDGTIRSTQPDGTVITARSAGDPRFGLRAPYLAELTRDTPAKAPVTTTKTRAVTLEDANDPFSLQTLTETSTTNGKTSSQVYDAATRTWTMTSRAGRVQTLRLDALARADQVDLPGVDAVTDTYDAEGRITSTVQGARTLGISFWADGTPQTLTDPGARSITTTWDAARRLTSTTVPEGGSVDLGYDASGNTTSLTPPGRAAHSTGYDARDLREAMTPPSIAGNAGASQPTTIAYDADRMPTVITLPGGEGTITNGYDSAGRLDTVTTPTGVYDRGYGATSGLVTSLSAPADGGTITYDYDGVLATSETRAGTVVGAVSRTYDADYRVASESAGGSNLTFAYDADSLVTGFGGAVTATIAREAATGRPDVLTHGAIAEDVDYDATYGELSGHTATETAGAASTLLEVDYTRDALGLLATRTEAVESGAAVTRTFTHDGNDRLTREQRSGGATSDTRYAYDLNGNRVSDDGDPAEEYAYDAQDRLVSSPHDGGTTYAYTADGRLETKVSVDDGTTAYDYDVLGGLRGVDLPAGADVSYLVDGEGHRIQRVRAGDPTRRWLYDRWGRVVAELDDTNALVARFVYVGDSHVPAMMRRGGSEYRILSDQVGSVRLVVDAASGAVVQRMDYDAFGVLLEDTNPGFQPFGFAGGLWDAATGLVRFGARDYDPAVGRFTAKDPLGFAAGTSNLYAYCDSDPVNCTDPSGLAPGAAPPQPSRAPDYIVVQGGLSVGLAGVTGGVTIDRYGRVYINKGVSGGKGPSVGGSAGKGYLNDCPEGHIPTPEELEKFLTGESYNAGAGFGVGTNFVKGSGRSAWEYGVTTPTAGGGKSWSTATGITLPDASSVSQYVPPGSWKHATYTDYGPFLNFVTYGQTTPPPSPRW